jgi:uncharacterized membrane protein YphA (DoxX/SURF4 family)
VVLLVALRLALGCHFLYEGVWKLTNPDLFALETEGFLASSRGPLAPMFFAMVPDLDGRQRLSGKLEEELVDGDTTAKAKKVKVVVNDERTQKYKSLHDRFVAKYPDLKDKADEVHNKQLMAVQQYLAENWDEIQAHFASQQRYEDGLAKGPNTAFQNKRNYDSMMKLRGEAKVWLAELDAHETSYKLALRDLLGEKAATTNPFGKGINIFAWPRMDQFCFAIGWGLSAIGLCLFLGLGTRFAALGGGIFMMFVVLSHPSFPGVVPVDPPQLGHALVINKDFVEMLALFVVASTAVGRWGGLDYFLETFIVEPFLSKTIFRGSKKG